MYTGKTEQPCCLCDDPDTAARIDLPPCAIPEMKHSDAIAWRDVVGEVSIHFCESDWEVVRDLVLDMGMSPLARCNVARASFDLKEDFEAMLNANRSRPDHSDLEARMADRSEEVVSRFDDPDTQFSERDLVEAHVRTWALEERATVGASD